MRFCAHCGAAVPEHAGEQHHPVEQYPAQEQQLTEVSYPTEASQSPDVQHTEEVQQPVEAQQPTVVQQPVKTQQPIVIRPPADTSSAPTVLTAPADTSTTYVSTPIGTSLNRRTDAPIGTGAAPTFGNRAQLERTFSISRNNLLAVLAFTCVNLVLALTNSDFFFLFSARIPLFLLYLDAYQWTPGSYDFSMFGIIAAFSSVSLYAIFWGVAKKHKGWIIAALVYFSIDILVMLFVVMFAGLDFELFSFIEIAFMAWIMFYLISGTRAWSKLRKMPQQDESMQYDQNYVDPQRSTIPVVYIPPSVGIRRPKKGGQILATQNYSNMEIIVKRTYKTTELIVNDMVYAERSGVHEKESYTLDANVYDVIVNVVMDIPSFMTQVQSSTLPTMYLYVNGNLTATKVRYY